MAEISYRRRRFPPVVIQHAVWLYLRFTLSYRDVEDLVAKRGLDISYETIRNWVSKFGPTIAPRLRRRRPRPSDRWNLDEIVVGIADELMRLWRAVDHEGEVLDIAGSPPSRRPGGAAADAQASQKSRASRQSCWSPTSRAPPARCSKAIASSAASTARAQDAALQVGSICPALPQHTRRAQGAGEYGRVAYFVSDGGTASPPPDGVVRPAKVLRVQF